METMTELLGLDLDGDPTPEEWDMLTEMEGLTPWREDEVWLGDPATAEWVVA